MQSLRDCVSEKEYTDWKKMLKNSLSFGPNNRPIISVFVALYESIKKGIINDFCSILAVYRFKFANNEDFRKLKKDFQMRLLISCQMTFPLVLFKEIYDHDFMIFYAALIMFSILLKRILEEEEKNKLQDSEAEIVEK